MTFKLKKVLNIIIIIQTVLCECCKSWNTLEANLVTSFTWQGQYKLMLWQGILRHILGPFRSDHTKCGKQTCHMQLRFCSVSLLPPSNIQAMLQKICHTVKPKKSCIILRTYTSCPTFIKHPYPHSPTRTLKKNRLEGHLMPSKLLTTESNKVRVVMLSRKVFFPRIKI